MSRGGHARYGASNVVVIQRSLESTRTGTSQDGTRKALEVHGMEHAVYRPLAQVIYNEEAAQFVPKFSRLS